MTTKQQIFILGVLPGAMGAAVDVFFGFKTVILLATAAILGVCFYDKAINKNKET